ncbi:MAG: hypothetical protein WD379_01010 [Dehalococcoidia bacterium]
MTISAAARDSLKQLAQLMIREEVEPVRYSLTKPFKHGRIPIPLKESAGAEALYIDGEELDAYVRTVRLLSKERELEHISAQDVDEELWGLVCEFFAKKREYRKEGARARAIGRFLDGLRKPWEDYSVISPVEHLTATIRRLDVIGVRLTTMSRQLASELGLFDSQITADSTDQLLGKAILVGSVRAGTARKAAEKGAQLIDNSLNALRVAVVGSILARTLDQQLLFCRGVILVVVSTVSGHPVFAEWHRPFEPISFEMRRNTAIPVARHLKPISDVICGTFPEPIQAQVQRAIHWIGTSVTRESYDDKIIDLCTALECLLTTVDDKMKGEVIALRSVLLPEALGEGFFDPFAIYELYEMRSKIVHGSKIGVCTRAHYERLLWETGVILTHYVQLVRNGRRVITRPSKAIEAIETPELLAKAVGWFERYPGNEARSIVRVTKERLASRTKR